MGKPNGGIIKIILKDGSTVIGMFKNLESATDNTNGLIELSNGQKISYDEIERIV